MLFEPGQPQVIGNRRIPKESVLARLFSHQGDQYDPLVVERDLNSLWNTGYFDDVRIEKVDTPKCQQLVIYVREKPTIREINYKGLNAVSQSDVLERFKKAKVSLSVESQYDPTKIKRAEVVLRDVRVARDFSSATAAHTTATALVSYADLSSTLGVTVGYAGDGRVRAEASTSVLGQTVRGSVTAEPVVHDGTLAFDAAQVSVGGVSLPAAATRALAGVFGAPLSLAGLPYGLSVRSVVAAADGLRLTVTARNPTFHR